LLQITVIIPYYPGHYHSQSDTLLPYHDQILTTQATHQYQERQDLILHSLQELDVVYIFDGDYITLNSNLRHEDIVGSQQFQKQIEKKISKKKPKT
jgi:hypothetical protein